MGLWLIMPTIALTRDEVGLLIGLASAVIVAIIGAIGLGFAAFVKLHGELRPNHGSSLRDAVDRIYNRLDHMERRQEDRHQQNLATNARQDEELAELKRGAQGATHHIVRQVAEVKQEVQSIEGLSEE